jgi:ribonuclease Z
LKFELTILGSGGAIPTINKKPTSQFLNIQDRYFLIDCGEGTQIQLRKFKCKFSKINHIFISHLHGDHYLGLIGFLASLNLLGRTNSINIYAPKNLEKLLSVHEEISKKGFSFKINLIPLDFNKQTIVYQDKIITVSSFPVSHSIPTCGFLFKENPSKRKIIKEKIAEKNFNIEILQKLKNGEDCIFNGEEIKNSFYTTSGPKSRSYAYCADTKYDEKILNYIANSDLLYHESTFLESMKQRAKKTFHSTALDAAKIAKKSNINKHNKPQNTIPQNIKSNV